MTNKSIAPLIIFDALLLTLTAVAFGQTPQTQVQTPPVQVQRATLPVEPTFSRMQTGDPSAAASALLLPDLTINGMCLEHDRKTGWNWLRVTLGNIGKADAGPFELGLVFSSPDGTEKMIVDKIAGLKVAEAQSRDYSPICCGWSKTNVLVETSAKFRAIADPQYYQNKLGYEVKPVVRESNEKNNELTVNKSELKLCSPPLQRMKTP